MNLQDICESVVEATKHRVSYFIQRFWLKKRSADMETTKEQSQGDTGSSASLSLLSGSSITKHEEEHLDMGTTRAFEELNATCAEKHLESSFGTIQCSSQNKVAQGFSEDFKEKEVDPLKSSPSALSNKVLPSLNYPSTEKSAEQCESSASGVLQTEENGTSSTGASSENVVPPYGAAGVPGMEMSKTMLGMMSKEGLPPMSGMSVMMSMMNGQMPDMKEMMSKFQAKGGREGMMGGHMGMKKLFDCVIEATLLTPDSDVSDDDEDSVTMELPCPYCSRFFASSMSLKTHILVAHEKEDPSVLNLKKLVIEEKSQGLSRDGSSKRKHSHEFDHAVAEAASSLTTIDDRTKKGLPVSEDLSAAQPGASSIKKSRIDRIPLDALDTSGAAAGLYEGNPDNSAENILSQPKTDDDSQSISHLDNPSPESRKRKALLYMQQSESSDMHTKKLRNIDRNSNDAHNKDMGESPADKIKTDEHGPSNVDKKETNDSDFSSNLGKMKTNEAGPSDVDKKETDEAGPSDVDKKQTNEAGPSQACVDPREGPNKTKLKTERTEAGRKGMGNDAAIIETPTTITQLESQSSREARKTSSIQEAKAIAVDTTGSDAAVCDNDSFSNIRRSLRPRKSR